MSPRAIDGRNGARFGRVPQKDHTSDDIDNYLQGDSPARQNLRSRACLEMEREPTSAVAALGSGLSSSVFWSANGAHAAGACAGAVALTAVGPPPCPKPPWSRDGAQFLRQSLAQRRRERRSFCHSVGSSSAGRKIIRARDSETLCRPEIQRLSGVQYRRTNTVAPMSKAIRSSPTASGPS
jgi:hypothetical protein